MSTCSRYLAESWESLVFLLLTYGLSTRSIFIVLCDKLQEQFVTMCVCCNNVHSQLSSEFHLSVIHGGRQLCVTVLRQYY